MSEDPKKPGADENEQQAETPATNETTAPKSGRGGRGGRKATSSAKPKASEQDSYIVARGRTVHTESGALGPGAEYDGPEDDIEDLVAVGFLIKRSEIGEQLEPTPGVSPA